MSERGSALRLEEPGEALPEGGILLFERTLAQLLERTEYRRCDTGEDREAIYRLRYKAYRTHGLVNDLERESISDKLDDAPNCYRFGVFIDGELASTMRVHHLTQEHPFSAAMSSYGDVIQSRLDAGESFVDPSRLAVDPDRINGLRALPYLTLRLSMAASFFFHVTSALAVIKPEHMAFYRRIFRYEKIAGIRSYSGLNVSVILAESNCERNLDGIVRRFPFFASTPSEQRMLFAKPKAGEPLPLTILPTAKYFRAAA